MLKIQFQNFFNSGKKVTDLLKMIENRNAISEGTYNKLKAVGSQPRTLYAAIHTHFSATGTPNYRLAKFLVLIPSDF